MPRGSRYLNYHNIVAALMWFRNWYARGSIEENARRIIRHHHLCFIYATKPMVKIDACSSNRKCRFVHSSMNGIGWLTVMRVGRALKVLSSKLSPISGPFNYSHNICFDFKYYTGYLSINVKVNSFVLNAGNSTQCWQPYRQKGGISYWRSVQAYIWGILL